MELKWQEIEKLCCGNYTKLQHFLPELNPVALLKKLKLTKEATSF